MSAGSFRKCCAIETARGQSVFQGVTAPFFEIYRMQIEDIKSWNTVNT
jgi:hypothetical protein